MRDVILRRPRSGPRRMATSPVALRGSPQARLAPQGDEIRRAGAIAIRAVRRCTPRQRAVYHVDRVLHAIDRDEGAEARAFLLAQEHLIEDVEPVERDAGPAVFRWLFVIEERLTPADLVDDVLDVLGARALRQVRQRVAQIQ